MNLTDAISAVQSGKASGFKCGNDSRYIVIKDNMLCWHDTKEPIVAAMKTEFFLYQQFELVVHLPDGWKRNEQNEIVKHTKCERWINVYFDRNTEEYIERDHRDEGKAIHESSQMAKGSIVFLRRLHTVNQYTLNYDVVYGRNAKSKFRL